MSLVVLGTVALDSIKTGSKKWQIDRRSCQRYLDKVAFTSSWHKGKIDQWRRRTNQRDMPMTLSINGDAEKRAPEDNIRVIGKQIGK